MKKKNNLHKKTDMKNRPKNVQKSQNETWNARYQYIHILIKTICIISIIFLTSWSLLLNILKIYK